MSSSAQEQLSASATPQKRTANNLIVRILTGLTLMPVLIIITLFGGVPLFVFALAIALLGTLEFYYMEKQRYIAGNWLIGVACAVAVMWAFHTRQSWLWQMTLFLCVVTTFTVELWRGHDVRQSLWRVLTTLGGVLYVAVPMGCLLAIRQINPYGLNWMYAVLFATWGTDTMAYLTGRTFGKTPFFPLISPKKTWEGAFGGIVGGIFFPSLVLIQIEAFMPLSFALLCISPFVAISGDLFESALKRYFGVKDSGIKGLNPFPGHGGVLDRIDALLWVTLIFYAFLAWQGMVGF